MAAIEQRISGFWQVRVRRKGYPAQSQTFSKRADAEAWARAVESEMDRGIFISRTQSERTTFKEAADRFAAEVLPAKRGGKQDGYVLRRLVEVFGDYSLAAVSSSMLASYRDRRLAVGMAPQSVVHELNLVSRLFKAASMDWGIALPAGNPVAMVRKPAIQNERSRRLIQDEEARLFAAIADPGPGRRGNPVLLSVVRFALETAARQSEIISLDWKDVDLDRRVARLRGIDGRETKNGAPFREVPLSSEAVDILQALASRGKVVRLKRGPVFNSSASAIKQSWERCVKRARDQYERETIRHYLLAVGLSERETIAEIRKTKPMGGPKSTKPLRHETATVVADLQHDPLLVDLHFHDLRHEATSRLADKLQMHELMKVTGHKSTKMLARYYHPRAEDLAKKLA